MKVSFRSCSPGERNVVNVRSSCKTSPVGRPECLELGDEVAEVSEEEREKMRHRREAFCMRFYEVG